VVQRWKNWARVFENFGQVAAHSAFTSGIFNGKLEQVI
jgi:hypothetical protein